MNGTIDIDIAIDNAATDYPALAQLLAGYYHQDWRQDHATPMRRCTRSPRTLPRTPSATAANDIDRLFAGGSTMPA